MATTETTEVATPLSAAQALAPTIRALADDIEAARQLPATLVDQLAQAGCFRLWMPRAVGGMEADPLTAMRVVEELARSDGSVGWCVMVHLQTTLFANRFLSPATAAAVFADPDAVLVGANRPSGRAVVADGGYRINGRWPFGSGASHARWFTGVCQVVEGDTPRLAPNGLPETRMICVPAAQVEVFDTWRTTGLRGTASNDWAVTDIFVPEERCVPQTSPSANPSPLYGANVLILSPQGAQALGIAVHAIDAIVELAAVKTPFGMTARLADQPRVQAVVAQAEALVGSARSYLDDMTRTVWETLLAGEVPSQGQRAGLSLAAAHAVTSAEQAVELMYRLGGGSAIQASNPLDRCLRDIHTAAAHVGVGPAQVEAAGRARLGLDPAVYWW